MKSFIKEFKEFAMKGNVVDLAVGMMIYLHLVLLLLHLLMIY